MAMKDYDAAIIGGGIVGLATARALLETGARSVVVLEAEDRLAAQTLRAPLTVLILNLFLLSESGLLLYRIVALLSLF